MLCTILCPSSGRDVCASGSPWDGEVPTDAGSCWACDPLGVVGGPEVVLVIFTCVWEDDRVVGGLGWGRQGCGESPPHAGEPERVAAGGCAAAPQGVWLAADILSLWGWWLLLIKPLCFPRMELCSASVEERGWVANLP